jgi:hypothetical protein
MESKENAMTDKPKRTPGPIEAFDSALDWMMDATPHTDQWERARDLNHHRKLFLAAPELLEVLNVIVAEVECYCGDLAGMVCPIHEARAVISKAEGK